MAITYLFTPEKTEVRLNGQDLCVTPELMVRLASGDLEPRNHRRRGHTKNLR